ncbi:MAG: 50S ribosomal protein L25 [Ignavibacteriae bacterium]|nr:50S ribosomal protein L25 [Ignavibacteriota bacterium]MCB9216773.1 50S ribosomal protein L25 [Ignavibacteria bacterium]
MSDITLEAKRREAGRSNARALRRQGIIPGVFYFHGQDSISLSVHELALRPLINTSESHLVNLKLDDGTQKLCILKDMDFDPITDRPVHFDLIGVAAGELMKLNVPISFVGRAAGQLDGGIVQHVLNELEIEVLPKNLPESIEIDISGLNIGDSIHVSDLTVENYTILNTPEATIVSVSAPRVSSDDDGAEEEVSMEPEVIGKGKKEEEE